MGIPTVIDEGEPPSRAPGRRAGAVRPALAVQNPHAFGDVDEAKLAAWTASLLADVAPGVASFTLRLTDEEEIRGLNRRYRGIDRSTDVLSFGGNETPEGWHLGDVVIGVPVARRQAGERGHRLGVELRLLALHGVLHCLGYDHETDDGTMARLEAELRHRWIEDA